MSYDEAFQLHEKLISPMRNLLGNEDLGIFYFAWVLPGIILVALLGLYFFSFLRQLPTKTRTRLLVAAGLYLGGAIGFELIGGAYAESVDKNIVFSFMSTTEEALEMAGLITLIWALLNYCNDTFSPILIQFEPAKTEA